MENENSYQIEEISGNKPEGIPLSPSQAYYLHEYIDPMIDRLIENMQLEHARKELKDTNFAEYMKRTHDQREW